MPAPSQLWTAATNRRLAAISMFGVVSGLPLLLTGGTLQAWMADANVDLSTIGLFSLVGLPYTVKFLWAPLMDRYIPPLLGRRRGWLLVTQLALIVAIGAMGLASPESAPGPLAALALGVALLSASQDIAADAYRTDILKPAERGLGASLFVTGYRVGMLISGSVALILADEIGWTWTYALMGATMGLGLITTWFAPAPEHHAEPPPSLRAAVVEPLHELFTRKGFGPAPARIAVALLALIILYKLGDAFAGSLTMAFLIKGVGFTKTVIGVTYKWTGFAGTIAGGLIGGILLARIGLYRSLLAFGILQVLTNFAFLLLNAVGASIPALIGVVALENLAGGMGTAAFVAFLMGLCDARFSATQYALLSALASVGRVLIGPLAGALAEASGWATFFTASVFVGIPGIAMLVLMRPWVHALDRIPGDGDASDAPSEA